MSTAAKLEFPDWLAITNAMHLYCRGLDRRDAESLSSAFWPDAIVNVGGGVDVTGTQFAEFAIPAIKRMFDKTMHRISNIILEGDGARATSECSLLAYHAFRQETGPVRDFLVGGRYLDQWEKRSGAWRMVRRQLVWDWHRTLGDTQSWQECLAGPPVATGGDWPTDWLYQSMDDGKSGRGET